MSIWWLCSKQTSQIALNVFVILLMVTSLLITYSFATTIKTITKTSHINTLNDDIERAEFTDNNIQQQQQQQQQPHTRKKRLIWITDDGRLALPPGTTLTITPTIGLPLVRHPPEGFFSNVSISFPLTIDFDKLGLTDNQNPLGDLPPIFARSFGYTASEILTQYLMKYLHLKRKRDISDQQSFEKQTTSGPFNIHQYRGGEQKDEEEYHNELPPVLPERYQHTFHGGERVILYDMLENLLSTFGLNGKACLLRAICEVHSRNLQSFGVFGEMVKLFLTATNSPFATLIPDYVEAQEIGEGHKGPGECFPYYKDCPKSIFKAMENHKYTENVSPNEYYEQDVVDVTNKQKLKLTDSLELNSNVLQQNNGGENKRKYLKIQKKYAM